LRFSVERISQIWLGLPLLILVAWTTKAFSPDLSTKSALTARDLDFRLELVSSGAALWKQLLLPLFTAACILFVIRWRHLFRAYISVLFPIGLLGAFLLASIFWSDHPDDTARRAIRQIFLFTSVAGAVVIGRSKNRFVTYFQTTSLILLVYESLFLLVPWISFDVFGKFTGIHATKNELGGIAGAFFLIGLAIYRYYAESQKEKRLALASILGWGLLLILSASKTPMGIVVLVGGCLMLSQHYVRLISIGVIALWLMIIVVIPMALLGFGEAPIDFYRSILPEEALTGRTGIWYHLLADLKKNWMFGTAYGAYWGVGDIPEALDIKWSYYQFLHTAHSGFVDLCMELGVIPTVFWLIVFWIFLVATKESSDPISQSLLAYGMLHNCLETSFLHGLHFVWVMMVISIANILYSHARRPNLDAKFRVIRNSKRGHDEEGVVDGPQTA
jgi:O-antigen ligase